MRLADYIVGYSLQINNRCLRFLADSHAKGAGIAQDGGLADSDELLLEAQPVFVESMLVRDSRRLLSMWSWISPQDEAVTAHHAKLVSTVAELTANVAPTRLALRLANQAAGEEDATRLLMLARALTPQQGIVWTELSELFANDSELWRSAELKNTDDDVLIEDVLLNYRKGAKVDRRLPRNWSAEPLKAKRDAKVIKQLRRQKKYSQASLHQLELLRPGLSEKGKRQLWYLDKLADAHRILSSLHELHDMVGEAGLGKQATKATKAYVAGQIVKIHKRVERLSPRAYESKPKRFKLALEQSLVSLGLETVPLLKDKNLKDKNLKEENLKEKKQPEIGLGDHPSETPPENFDEFIDERGTNNG